MESYENPDWDEEVDDPYLDAPLCYYHRKLQNGLLTKADNLVLVQEVE